MLRSVGPALLGLATAVVVAVGSPAAASTSPPGGCQDRGCPSEPSPGDGGGAGASSGGGSITVQVSGTAVRGGGEQVEVPASSVRAHPVCWYGFVATGAEYASWWDEGRFDELMRRLPEEDHFEPYPGYGEHRDDTEGGWWSPRCSSAHWPDGDWDGFFDYTNRYFDTHTAVYVVPGEVPPGADVPPEVLAEIAYEQMELPVGRLAWNPMRAGDGATVVGVDTWVWVEDALESVSVTASVSTGTWARVDASLAGLSVHAPGSDGAQCVGAGVAWSEGADPAGACRVWFDRSSANQPVKAGLSVPTATMTAEARWTASWVSSLDPTPRELTGQSVEASAEVPVAEIQSLVTASG
ncbi:hypothetical protein GCM10010972_15090 [Cellulomonas carbonis]|uniref:ATP/GTP-binding protein n=1 Tax=Cellulomonas carbonis T26 TaxID=947969 RepID=A0A0A0BVE1_9CELL|nr:hypothetical protein [Cellulomonas carbonis]KGM11647.1 hypothetical protein N868_08280 [Cellulomonas carbonis T26]GGC03054.1 hypothetical protein GCM10010972_15090 [Cellulomonas carbonis]